MSGRRAVPLCHNQIRGYTFPKDNASRKRWVTAVKLVSGDNKPWSLTHIVHDNDVVCKLHLTVLSLVGFPDE